MLCEYLNELTAQQVFDRVARHLLTQGEKATAFSRLACMYRTDTGLKCAAGCLIPDAEYYDNLEYKSWGELRAEGIVSPAHSLLILSLQRIHDNNGPSLWLEKLQDLASKNDLSPAILSIFPAPIPIPTQEQPS